MTEQNDYKRMGRFIYGAVRHGGDMSDVRKWMADDLKTDSPEDQEGPAANALYAKYFAKYENDEAFEANFLCFLETIQHRRG